MSESHETGGMSEFERQLSALRPSELQLDRAVLLFRAGQESVPSTRGGIQLWGWRCAAVLFAMISLAQVWSGYHSVPIVAGKAEPSEIVPRERDNPLQESQVGIPETISTSTLHGSESISADGYLSQRRLAFSEGFNSVANSVSASSSARLDSSSYRDLRYQMSNWQ